MKLALSEAIASPGKVPAETAPKTWAVGSLSYTKQNLFVLFFWLLWGDFAWSIRDRVVGPVMGLILTKYHVSDTVAGLLCGTLPAILGFFLGPVFGMWSDQHRGRLGRRIPFLIASVPIAAISIVCLGLSPQIAKILHEFLGMKSPGYNSMVVIVLAFWWTIFGIAGVTNGLFTALINDVVPHALMGRFFGLFRAVSLIVGIIFNFWLFGWAEEHYFWLFLAVGAIYGIGVMSMCFKVKEGEYPPPTLTDKKGFGKIIESAGMFFKQGFTIPYYLWFFVGSTLGSLATSPVNLYSIFFAKHLNMPMSTFGAYTAATFVISLLITYPVGALVDRFHPLRMTMVTIILYAIGVIASFFYVHDATTFGIAMLIHGVLSGAFYTVSAPLNQCLLPREIFAQIGAAGGIIGSVFNIGLPLLLGVLLDYFHHEYRLTFLIGGVISCVSCGCLYVVYQYWKSYGGSDSYIAPI